MQIAVHKKFSFVFLIVKPLVYRNSPQVSTEQGFLYIGWHNTSGMLVFIYARTSVCWYGSEARIIFSPFLHVATGSWDEASWMCLTLLSFFMMSRSMSTNKTKNKESVHSPFEIRRLLMDSNFDWHHKKNINIIHLDLLRSYRFRSPRSTLHFR